MSSNIYLRHLTYKGAERNYKEITEEIRQRIDFELETIKTMACSDYFLIVQEIIQAAREMDILFSPGRGSAVGSVVNYCLGTTGIDPLKYDLSFERFLNPDYMMRPRIDFDLEENGRDKVLRWIIEKYGKERVAQLATFAPNEKLKINPCAIVIGADNLDKFIPLATIKPWYSDEEMVFTSCDRPCIEEIGLVILSFIEFRTLSVIKETLSNIKKSKGTDLDISKIPLDDAKTFELYRKGDTKGVFQFELPEAQNYVQEFEDLIAPNAPNKSHATAYALVSYQTAYLKTNFTKEFEDANANYLILK